MSNHYDDYYPSADDIAKARKQEDERKISNIMNHFKVTRAKAVKMQKDFNVLFYNR
ncbi:hypothetical protein HWC29_gp029 [Aeromonas phage 4_4572]|nr:hypothetical protein HWC29_gp029 [Aeromonas phage 4_4572]QEG09027.1 hypothetical protein [Aeromonas phage 4_4572]